MRRAFFALVPVGLVLLLAPGCQGGIVVPGCDPVTCKLACENGFAKDESGCEICQCAPPPGGCPGVLCDLFCENGFATGADGCPICECAAASCEGSNPAGCVSTGCPSDSSCDTSQGCAPSECYCDEGSGSWACTNDCGGGVCVPAGGACSGPDPSGCVSKGCDPGQICDTTLGCYSSGCACDPATGAWGCTPDCSGGVCVADPTGCDEPDPSGCVDKGCPIGQTCMQTSGVCVPSSCVCDPGTGTWGCTEDCGGGVCVDEG